MIVTVLGSAVGMSALLLTVMTLLIGSVNARIDDLRDTVNARIDDTNARIDDLNDRMTGLENEMREVRSLVIEALKTVPPANE